MNLQLQASRSQLQGLKRIVDLGKDKLVALMQVLSGVESTPLRPEALIQLATDVVGADDAEPLVRQLVSIHGIKRQSGLGVDEVVRALRVAIEPQAEEHGIDVQRWIEIEETFKQLVETTSVRITTKALELSYDYANLLRRSKFITDIRPLYNEEGDHIDAAVVSYTLRLRYETSDGEHELSLALDDADVRELHAECLRAMTKAKAAKEFLNAPTKLPNIVSGENDA